ncbi:MAG TPA: DUF1259 domain-containing protein [Burkholderiales bacterium]|nr:DUF1259 domain-containing protein [Burkholderiales bacterium]
MHRTSSKEPLLFGIACAALALSTAAGAAGYDWSSVDKAIGRKGSEMPGGVYRVGIARSDLKVTLDGVQIKPPLALGSYMAFQSMGKSGMVMGDLVLLQDEVNPVMKKLVEGGIQITAIHNHLLRSDPFIMYMHYEGRGDPAELAATIRGALEESKTPLEASAPAGSPPPVDLDTAAIEKTLGAKGNNNGGVLAFSIPRAETIEDAGMTVPPAAGMGIAINFQPTGEGKAAITGDFVLIAKEVNPVLKTLRENGIEVTALHSHMLNDQPRLYFMHFWANDDAQKLATGLKAGLDKVNRKK